MAGSQQVAARSPTPLAQAAGAGGIVYRRATDEGQLAGSYATEQDLVDLSLPADTRHSFPNGARVRRHLVLASRRVDEWLGQRFAVPLSAWSDTVVYAVTELAYCSLARLQGQNTEGDLQSFVQRVEEAYKWLKDSRDHMITPDVRLSDADIPQQAVRYLGPASRGWDQPPGYGGTGEWG